MVHGKPKGFRSDSVRLVLVYPLARWTEARLSIKALNKRLNQAEAVHHANDVNGYESRKVISKDYQTHLIGKVSRRFGRSSERDNQGRMG